MVDELEGKVALVTGSSRGIGRAIAMKFAEEGASLCINYVKSSEKAVEVAEEVRALGRRAIVVKADVSRESEVKRMIERVVGEFGKIDILVNNAGLLYPGSLLKMSDREFQRMIEVNVKGILYCSREAAKYMIKNRYGKIINIASNAGIGTAFPDTTPYAATKAAVIILTKRLAFELGEYGINVNAIAPGLVLTDMITSGRSREEVEKIIDLVKGRTVLRRVGRPEDIANVALFLASDASSYITGQVIVADGGRMDYLSHSI